MVKLKSLIKEKTLNERPNQDTEKLSKILGKNTNDIYKFVTKYGIEEDDLLDVLDSGSSSQRRRYSMAILAAMKGNRRALKQLDNLLGFLPEQKFNERTTGFTDSGRGYQSKEAQTFSVNAVKDASKKVGKLQQNVVGQFIKDIKQNKYDAMDLVRSIKTTSLGDASFSKKEFFLSLFDLIKKRTR